MKKQISLLFIIVFSSLILKAQGNSISQLLDNFDNHPEYTLVAAHRAAHLNYAENSRSAIEEAIRLNIDIVELDVRETKDHELVIIHDRTVDRTTNGKGKVKDLTLKELKSLSLLHDKKTTSDRMLTFEEALKETKDKIIMDIDFKAEGKKALNKAIALLQKYQMTDQVLFYIYDNYKLISYLHKKCPDMRIMPRAYNPENVDQILKHKNFNAIHVDFKFYSDDLCERILKDNKRVWANALGKYDEMEQNNKNGYDEITKKKINVIQTNYPEELLKYLKDHHLHP